MPILLVLFSLFVPRVVVALLWFLTDWFHGMFDTVLWPVLGFFFLPTTLLWYSAVQHWFNGEWTLWPIVGLVVALLIDVRPGRKWSNDTPRPSRRRVSRVPSHA